MKDPDPDSHQSDTVRIRTLLYGPYFAEGFRSVLNSMTFKEQGSREARNISRSKTLQKGIHVTPDTSHFSAKSATFNFSSEKKRNRVSHGNDQRKKNLYFGAVLRQNYIRIGTPSNNSQPL
jgi:hypothetical protein